MDEGAYLVEHGGSPEIWKKSFFEESKEEFLFVHAINPFKKEDDALLVSRGEARRHIRASLLEFPIATSRAGGSQVETETQRPH